MRLRSTDLRHIVKILTRVPPLTRWDEHVKTKLCAAVHADDRSGVVSALILDMELRVQGCLPLYDK